MHHRVGGWQIEFGDKDSGVRATSSSGALRAEEFDRRTVELQQKLEAARDQFAAHAQRLRDEATQIQESLRIQLDDAPSDEIIKAVASNEHVIRVSIASIPPSEKS